MTRRYEPKPHQQIAERWLMEKPKACLFLDMGLGKTVVTLTCLDRHLREEMDIDRALVIAPASVAETVWQQEARKWGHLQMLRVERVVGTQKQRIAALERRADVYVIGRDNVQWLVEYLHGRWPYDAVVLDELSSFKNSSSKRWRMLKRVIGQSQIVWGLTGTPAPNGYIDLWAEMYLVDNGDRLGKFVTRFRDQYFSPGRRKGPVVYEWRIKRGAQREIDRKLGDICLSMSKGDWLAMPELIVNTVTVRMSEQERRLYDQFKREHILPLLKGAEGTLENMDAAVVGPTAAAVQGKLLQLANGNVYDDEGAVFHVHDRKLDALEEISEAAVGNPVLVFYWFKHDLEALRKRFPQAVELRDAAREDVIARWNRGEIPMLLCHPASAGHGINLQEGGHIAVWYGLTWSLELYQQANARLYRQGQTERVIVHHIVAEDTVDGIVMDALQKKDATQQGLLDALKTYLREDAH